MKASGLRGRGGAGFPTGLKWSFMPKPDPARPSYLVVNADEIGARHLQGPGNHAQRSANLIEGCFLACFAMQAHACYIYIRGEFILEGRRLEAAIAEAYAPSSSARTMSTAGLSTFMFITAPAPIFVGEETALLSRSRQEGMPRLKPPFPANMGLYGCPTTVNNVESIACASDSPPWRRYGSASSARRHTGTKLFLHFRPCQHAVQLEEAMSIPFRD